MWIEVGKSDLARLGDLATIQKTMGSAYKNASAARYVRLLNRKQDAHIFFYSDADTEIMLMFMYKPVLDKIKIAYGSLGKFKDVAASMNIAALKISESLKSKKKKGYAILGERGATTKGRQWYAEISRGMSFANIRATKNGFLWQFEARV